MAQERRFIECDRCGSGTGTPEEGDGKRWTERGSRGGGPDSLRWFWSLTVNGPMTRSDRVATLEEAKAQFRKVGMPGSMGEAGRGAGQIMINFWDDNSHA